MPTVGSGVPSNKQGNEGDISFRVTSNGLKLYIKAKGSWHGVKVGNSFDSIETSISDIKSRLSKIETFKLFNIYPVKGDYTLDVSGDIELNADGGQVTIKDALASHFLFDCDNTKFTMYDDANANDYFSIAIAAEGATTILTYDADTAAGHLTLDPDGELNLTPVTEVKSDAPLKIKEAANAVADTAAYGQLWVKTATPNNLYFTDDAGNDIQLTSGLAPFIKYQYETKVTNFYSTATANYLPLSGGVVETTSTLGKTENVCIVAPFNGTLERAVFRSEIAQNGDLIFAIHESSDGTEAPALGSVGSKTTAINIADDTAQIVDFDSMTSGSNVITKGRIYAIKLTAPSGPQDTVITLVFKWDATS